MNGSSLTLPTKSKSEPSAGQLQDCTNIVRAVFLLFNLHDDHHVPAGHCHDIDLDGLVSLNTVAPITSSIFIILDDPGVARIVEATILPSGVVMVVLLVAWSELVFLLGVSVITTLVDRCAVQVHCGSRRRGVS